MTEINNKKAGNKSSETYGNKMNTALTSYEHMVAQRILQ